MKIYPNNVIKQMEETRIWMVNVWTSVLIQKYEKLETACRLFYD